MMHVFGRYRLVDGTMVCLVAMMIVIVLLLVRMSSLSFLTLPLLLLLCLLQDVMVISYALVVPVAS